MGAKLPRRDLLKTLGAAAVGTTACVQPTTNTPPPIRLPRVNLICHGMLLFWQDRKNPKNGITIYLPDTMGTHQVRLSANIGGLPNLIDMPGHYALQLTRTGLITTSKQDKTTDVALFDDMGTKGLAVNTANTPWEIDVPYPNAVRRFRIMKFSADHPPYNTTGSDTEATFDIKPREMAGAHVFTYDGVSTPVTLQKPDGSSVSLTPAPMGLLNLHLYVSVSQMAPTNHLRFFNAMLQYTGHPTLDLVVANKMPKMTDKKKEPVPEDLSHLDIYDLYELQDDAVESADPAGCCQGWGS